MSILKVVGITYLALISFQTMAYGPCDDDEANLCSHSSETTRNCLHMNLEKLTVECRAFVDTKHPEWKQAKQALALVQKACEADTAKLCPEETTSMKPFLFCMMSHGSILAPSCKKAINEHITTHLPSLRTID